MSNDGAWDVVERRHIVVALTSIPGLKSPYHYVEKLGLKEAENYLANCSAPHEANSRQPPSENSSETLKGASTGSQLPLF
jgi:hypothetical protein